MQRFSVGIFPRLNFYIRIISELKIRWNFNAKLMVSKIAGLYMTGRNKETLTKLPHRMPKFVLIVLFALSFFTFSKNPLSADDRNLPVSAVSIPTASAEKSGLLTSVNFEDSIQSLYDQIGLSSYLLPYKVFRLGMIGYYSLEREGALNNTGLLTIIDFSRPSTAKRFYTIDLKKLSVKYHTYVAHGRNTGENMATAFSNIPNSNQSSLGFYVTGETYVGSKGYSLRLDGKEQSYNDKIRSRAVVIHAADYATESWIQRYGRLGRSQGCPALPPKISREVIDLIKGKTAIFTYFPDETYLGASQYLRLENLLRKLDAQPVQLAATPARQS